MPSCPKCGCQIQDPFRGTIIIHDVNKCTGYKRNTERHADMNWYKENAALQEELRREYPAVAELIEELEAQLHAELAEVRAEIHTISCTTCGSDMELVRPGKWQCQKCELDNMLKQAHRSGWEQAKREAELSMCIACKEEYALHAATCAICLHKNAIAAMEYTHKEEGKMKHGEKFEKWMLSQCKECAYELVSDFEHVAEHCSECKLRFKAAFNAGAAEIADDCWGNSESVARAIREEIG